MVDVLDCSSGFGSYYRLRFHTVCDSYTSADETLRYWKKLDNELYFDSSKIEYILGILQLTGQYRSDASNLKTTVRSLLSK